MALNPTKADLPGSDEGAGATIDARLVEESRRGLTGTARSDVYEPTREPDDVSRAPDPRDDRNPPEWRQDFPIDWPKDEFLARREFAKFLVLTSSAFVAGQGWIAARDLVRSRRDPTPAPLKIPAVAELAPGESTVFAYPGEHDRCVLVRLPDGELVAFSQLCTHLSCPVIPKVDEGVFACPCHEGYFDIRTGKNIAGPPPRPLPRILLRIEGRDVYAVGVEQRAVG
jgi:nitrite reductase/ring-hydroxylating ferredoxin subunit